MSAAALDEAAFSADGYIIDQGKTGALAYGRFPSNYNGCGWIAAYNFFLAVGRPQPPEQTCAELAAGSPFRCALGTGPRRLRGFLAAKGFATGAATRRKKALALARKAEAGILLYLDGAEPHLVAFAEAGQGRFRFFNALPGEARHLSTLADFFKAHTRRLPVYVMLYPERD